MYKRQVGKLLLVAHALDLQIALGVLHLAADGDQLVALADACLLYTSRLGVHGVDGPLGVLPHGLVAEDEARPLVPVQTGNDGIFPDVQDSENTRRPALLGEQGKRCV